MNIGERPGVGVRASCLETSRVLGECVTRHVTDTNTPSDSPILPMTMTHEETKEMNEIEGRKIVVLFPIDIFNQLQNEAAKANLDARHLVQKIVRKWLKKR